MTHTVSLFPMAALAAALSVTSASALGRRTDDVDIEVRTNRDDGAIFEPGDEVTLRVKVSRASYVALYDIDTEGRVHLLYPTDPDDEYRLRAGKTYNFPLDGDGAYIASGPEGVEYIYAIASSRPLWSRLPWNESGYDVSRISYRNVEGDPFEWCGRLNEYILNDDPYGVSDYTYFYVERRVAYPRYVCSDCHGGGYYAGRVLRPYYDRCSTFDIRISAGWSYRSRSYVHRTCPPLYVYYRRDSCPPRWSSLPRQWSSARRWEIRERFSDLRREPPRSPGGSGGSAWEKDRDVRNKPRRAPDRYTWTPSKERHNDLPPANKHRESDGKVYRRDRSTDNSERAPAPNDRRTDDRSNARNTPPPNSAADKDGDRRRK